MCVRVCVCETSQLAESVLKLKQNGWCEAGNVSLWEHTGVKKWHISEIWKRNTLEHIETQKYKIELEK